MVYETGETEELQVDELIRDSIMSLGWVPAPGPARPDSAGQLSVAGVQHSCARCKCHHNIWRRACPLTACRID